MRTDTNECGSNENAMPAKQRALVLQGGGTLGAYEAGVLEVLCKKISEEDEENNYYSLGGDLHEDQEENKGE